MFCTHHLHGGSPEIIPKEVHYRSPGSQVFVFYNGWHVVKHKTASQSLIVADRHRHHKNRGVHSVVLHSQAYPSFTAASQNSQWNLSVHDKKASHHRTNFYRKKEIIQKCIILTLQKNNFNNNRDFDWDSLTWFQILSFTCNAM